MLIYVSEKIYISHNCFFLLSAMVQSPILQSQFLDVTYTTMGVATPTTKGEGEVTTPKLHKFTVTICRQTVKLRHP